MIGDLVTTWRSRADQLRPYAPSAAKAFEVAAADLDREVAAAASELLTLAEAEAASGYSRETLRRKIRQGRIPNAGRPHAPRIRRGDLPRKAGQFDERRNTGYDPVADARQVTAVRNRGGTR